MRVGLVILPQRPWSEQAAQWRAAEQFGFAHLWTYDHLTWDPLAGTPWGATLPTLVAAAAVTTTARLGTWVASPNFRHPVPFARELAALDDISGGRALLGVGAGGTGHDAAVLGSATLSPGQRAGRFEEFVEVLDLVLTRPSTTWRGTWYQAVDARTTLAPIRVPRLPFAVAANGPRTLRLAARLGQAWVTTGGRCPDDDTWWGRLPALVEAFEAACVQMGRDPATIDRMLSVDAAPTFSMVSAAHFEDVVGRARALGFTDVVTHWPLPGAPVYDAAEAVLGQVAALLPGL